MVAKVEEELQEVREAETADDQKEEVGDLLFAVVNLARHMKIDPEEALRAANSKFERRFRIMEINSISQDIDFQSISIDEKEILWRAAKAQS